MVHLRWPCMRRCTLFFFVFFLSINSLSAQFFYFGQNKVQYTDFHWHVLRTKHFDIYYYPEMKGLAEEGAYLAEEGYAILESKFDYTVLHRIPLIFYSSHLDFEQTNTVPGFIPQGEGGFFEFLKGRVVIPADGSIAHFRHVIRHELVHVFMEGKLAQVLSDHHLPEDRTPPLWFTEGLAEAWSTTWDDQAEMVIRDAVLNNYIVPISDMEKINGTFLMYKEGQNIINFIQKEYGEEKILLLMENFWRSSSFDEDMSFTIGKSFKEIDDEWIYSLKKKYYPLLATNNDVERVAQTLVGKGFNTEPVFYNNNGTREIYFIADYTGYTSVYKIAMDSAGEKTEPTVVITGEKSDEFEAFHLLENKLAISKSGLLAFVTKMGESDVLHLYDVRKNVLAETLRFRNIVMFGSPCWSPDGMKLAFTAADEGGEMDLYIYTPATKSLLRVTNDVYDDRDPTWSPDGRYIVFSSDRDQYGSNGIYNLFSYEVSTGKISYVTAGDENYYSPSFSPDGKYLTFTSDVDGVQNIWALDAGVLSEKSLSYAMKKVTNFSNAAFDPDWTDNDELIFSGFENYSFRIYSLPNVSAIIDSSRSFHEFTPAAIGAPWFANSIQGDTSVEFLPYKGKYSLDIAQTQISTDPVFGTGGGAAVAMSDELGNDQYYFLLYNDAQSSGEFLQSFNLAITKVSLAQRTNYAAGIFHFSGQQYDLTDPDIYYYERSFGGYFALSYPLSKFERIETSTTLTNSDKELVYGVLPLKALLLSNSISFIHDNSLWGPTGPIDGSRFLATLGYTTDIQYSNVSYFTLIGDYRNYWRLGLRTAFASRFAAMYNDGRQPREFFMGGSWDLRGYPRWSIRGEKLWLTSQEFRFPFIDELGLRFPFGGLSIDAIRGALFFDAGNAWNDTYGETLGSIGGGIRFNIGGFLVLRYDVGKTIDDNFTKLQNGLFSQFFFGWDF
jgi:WD40 repeat protein